MKSFGKKVNEIRKQKGLSQESLAISAKVNLRTIQRIESDENEPRESTIKLICEALELDQNEFIIHVNNSRLNGFLHKSIDVFFLGLLNITIASIVIYLAAYDSANLYTRLLAFLFCLVIPYVIVLFTENESRPSRLLKFGVCFFFVLIFSLFQMKMSFAISSGVIPFSFIGLTILNYGDILKFRKKTT